MNRAAVRRDLKTGGLSGARLRRGTESTSATQLAGTERHTGT